MPELINVPWPGWQTVRLIGRGSFGTVYEIQRKLVDGATESAAVKVITLPHNPSDIEQLHNEGYDDESITASYQIQLKSIVAEYSLMRKMDGSANVVNCKDISYIQHEDGIGWDIFIRMELLTPLLKALPPQVPEELVIRIGRDICNALILCRKNEIVHRDVKPQNIFVSPNGDYKLGDFGIAKTMESTMGGTRIGTYKYMAPEVYNNQPYGSAADIYSLGLVMYWLLNMRRMPFVPLPPETMTAEQEEKAWLRRISGEKMYPPVYGSDELKRIIMKACAYDPKDRYASAVQMLEDLHILEESRATPIATPVVPVVPAVADADATVRIAAVAVDPEATLRLANGQAQERKFCTGCGAEILGQKNFCPKCGKPVAAPIAPKPADPERTVHVKHAPPVMPQPNPIPVAAAPVNQVPRPAPQSWQPAAVRPKEKKKGKGLIWVIVAILAVAILAVGAYFLFFREPAGKTTTKKSSEKQTTTKATESPEPTECTHQWGQATCTTPAVCTLCKETKGAAEGHQWEDATCTMAKHCTVCGETEGEPISHRYTQATRTEPSTCIMCGSIMGTRVMPSLKVTNLVLLNGQRPQCECKGTEAKITVPSLSNFYTSEIGVQMADGQAVDITNFNFAKNGDTITITFQDPLIEGVYEFTFVCEGGEVHLSLLYGYEGDIYMTINSIGWTNRKFQNAKTKGYLVQMPNSMETSNNIAEATVFANKSKMCDIVMVDENTADAVPFVGFAPLVTKQYSVFGGADYLVFTYDGWYLTADDTGRVYFTKTLTDACYWTYAA